MSQVFDGHNGKDAAQFVKERLLNFIVRDSAFPTSVEKAVQHAFLHADTAFAEACSEDECLSSGTTALTALVLGRFVSFFEKIFCFLLTCNLLIKVSIFFLYIFVCAETFLLQMQEIVELF